MNTNQALIEKLEQLAGEKLTLNHLLKSIRLSEELSQVEFAKKLGVSKQFVCDLEHDRRLLSLKMAKEFALKLGYSEAQFIRICLQDLVNSQGLHEYRIDLLFQSRRFASQREARI